MKEIIKLSREDLIEHLITSWRDHYEQMDDDFLIAEYGEYLSEDASANIEIIILGEK
jgi:hypothetical protein